jgi:hypothetical protein
MTTEIKAYPKCVECKHHSKKAMGEDGILFICHHPAFGHPVTGQLLPCLEVRKDPAFCGVEGRGYEEKSKIELPPNKGLVLPK